ncbi:regulator of Vps4 activity in the MVB pathway protein [Striga asiatica]|uniref:Regulator of Vps4 activity in the MVB pathway protein n=1 Tax=Striga asiatica TaxID=4170 RepID=A0A5A7PJF3_STRAF|nr:regulator of Vps4 activity in the MVB pathway protein [Striga asiatica]
MGKKLDAFLRRGFRTSKFKSTVAMALSRLAVLRNHRQARRSIARSDVIELLKNNTHERALLRVDQVIKEQNMLDVFDLVEDYCHLLLERIHIFEQEKVCPEELKEVVSTLIYVATRCGDFPELQQIRSIFASRFGREFVDRAAELRNNCGVNPKIIQKLSTRILSLESKMKILKEIASENNIELQIEEASVEIKMEHKEIHESSHPGPPPKDNTEEPSKPEDDLELLSRRRKYRDVADAAQAAFESAAYAAAAARAAVELSRSGSSDPSRPHTPTRSARRKYYSSGDEEEMIEEKTEFDEIRNKIVVASEAKGLDCDSGSDYSFDGNVKKGDGEVIKQRDEVVFDEESDDGVGERGNNAKFSIEKREKTELSSIDGLSFDGNVKGDGEVKKRDNVVFYKESDDGVGERGNAKFSIETRESTEPSSIDRVPFSVRTKRTH